MVRVQQLRPDMLAELPVACRECLFWEVVDAARGPETADPETARKAKEAWWQAQALEEPVVSRRAVVDDAVVGFVLAGTASSLPRSRRLGPPTSDDALVMATLWVHEDHRSGGVGKALVHSVLREASQRGFEAVEAHGRLDSDPHCVLSVAQLEAFGFVVARQHLRFPLLRLDLRQTVSWTESVGHAIEGVIGALRRRERAQRPVVDGAVES